MSVKGKDVGTVAGTGIGAAVGGPVGAGIGGALGGMVGGMFDGTDNAGQAQLDQILANIRNLPTPEARQQALVQLQAVANYQSQKENAINAGEAAQIKEDPALRQAQLNALQLMSKASSQGLNAQDRADLNKVRNEVARDSEAKRQQILQNFQARGQAGSGNELASALVAAQGGADRQSEESDRIAAMSQQRALDALRNYSAMGAQARASDLAVNQQNVGAQNEFKRFDISGQREAQARNIAAANNASNLNQQNLQNVANTNFNQKYQTDNTNYQREQDALNRKYQQSALESNALTGQANNEIAKQTAQNQGSADTAAGLSGIIASSMKNQSTQPTAKVTEPQLNGAGSSNTLVDFNNTNNLTKKKLQYDQNGNIIA